MQNQNQIHTQVTLHTDTWCHAVDGSLLYYSRWITGMYFDHLYDKLCCSHWVHYSWL